MIKRFLQFVTEDENFERLHPRDKIGRFAKKREKKSSLNDEFDEEWWSHTHRLFPNCNKENVRIVSGNDREYNCAAFAFGDNTRWWWPGSCFWPEEAIVRVDDEALPSDVDNFFFEENVDEKASFEKFFEIIGAEKTDNTDYEEGYVKIALYSKDGVPVHVSRLMDDDGTWCSKMGGEVIVEHEFNALNNGYYGNPKQIYRIPMDKFKKIRDMGNEDEE